MATASDQSLAAASAPPAPKSRVDGQVSGADVGTSSLTLTSAATSPRPPLQAIGLQAASTTTGGIGITASSSTSTLAGNDSPPAQIISDIPPVSTAARPPPNSAPASASPSPSVNSFAIRPSYSRHSHSNSNGFSNIPRTSHSPGVPPSTPGKPTDALPKGGTKAGRWTPQPHQKHLAASTPAKTKMPAKVPIVDPGTGRPAPPPQVTGGFPSPKSEALQTNQKFLDDCARINFGVQQALPEAVRRSVRDNWDKCLLGSDFHQAFVLNASIHHATPAALQRGMRDFGKNLITTAKTEIMQQMTTHDLDQVADLILSKASVAFFDKVLELRLKTIDAKRLINALARAERLGYEIDDVVDEDDKSGPAPPPQPQPSPAGLSTPGPVLPAAQPGLVLHCNICFRRFPAQSAYDHHVKGRVCTRSPSSPGGFKYNCQHCGQGFTTTMGLQYHNANKVCGDFGEHIQANLVRNPPVANPSPIRVAQSQTPIPVPSIPSHVATNVSSPITPSASKTASPAPSQAGTPNVSGDPYSHLSPEQHAALQSELREAELHFAERMRQVNLLADPVAKKAKLDGLSNSYGTKQSNIRKKYGVRLRSRRTKAEIQQERDRMQYRTPAEMQAEMLGESKRVGRPLSKNHAGNGSEPRDSAAGGSGWAAVNQPTTTLASNIAVPPAPKMIDSGDVSMHGSKRRFSGGEASGSKRVAYADMGGLSGAKAEPETMDPTRPKGVGTKDEPVALDGDSSDSDSSSSESGDEDIPAELPANVRQTLVRSSPAGGQGRSHPDSASRAGSSSAVMGP